MLEIKHLRTIQQLALSNTLAEAATRLHCSPSALSHQLKELELRLGQPVYQRKQHPLQLTHTGRLIQQLAAQVLPAIHALEQQLRQQRPLLQLGVECHSCFHWLLPLLKKWQHRADWSLTSHGLTEANKLLELCDLVFTNQPVAQQPATQLGPYPLVVAMAADHPLASYQQLTPEQLVNEKLLCYDLPLENQEGFRLWLLPAGITPPCQAVDNNALMLQMAAAGSGLAIMPWWVVEQSVRLRLLAAVPAAHNNGQPVTSHLYAQYRQDHPHAGLLNTMTQACQQHYRHYFSQYMAIKSANASTQPI